MFSGLSCVPLMRDRGDGFSGDVLGNEELAR